MSAIKNYQSLLQLTKLFQSVKQISWTAKQVMDRFPAMESLTEKEIDELVKVYLALGFDLETITKEWKVIYGKYKDKQEKLDGDS